MLQPNPAETGEYADREKRQHEGERFGEVGAPQCDAQPCGVAQPAGGQMSHQGRQCEQKKRLQQRIRPHLAQRKFTLAGDHQQRKAQVAQRIAIERAA